MFGSIGFPELIMIFIIALLLFGPNKLPDIAKTLGKTIQEFRKTVNEAKATIDEEIKKAGVSEIADDLKKIDSDAKQLAVKGLGLDNDHEKTE
ncbi:MAG TPA: Sec-independent protein translocase protein TatB [Candidatus Deferrimicrobium sp.]|nr:Sec-independent protein translocase protein TatB [Candidatus Deferrimicrobium sp.]